MNGDTNEIFTTKLKLGKITPTHKTGDLRRINNYRPITVVCVISKIIEILIKNRIKTFI